MKIAILGAAGGIGQALGLLLKTQLPAGSELSLYDIAPLTPGVAVDLSHIPTAVKVTGFSGEDPSPALKNVDIVLISAGVARKPGMARADLFNINAGINLLKFKDKAVYEDGRETSLTGKEAYTIYSNEVKEHLRKVGGKAIFWSEVTRLMLGDVEELWDVVGIAMYPNKSAMMTMMTDLDYIESEKHRSAGLKGQLNIETIGKIL